MAADLALAVAAVVSAVAEGMVDRVRAGSDMDLRSAGQGFLAVWLGLVEEAPASLHKRELRRRHPAVVARLALPLL